MRGGASTGRVASDDVHALLRDVEFLSTGRNVPASSRIRARLVDKDGRRHTEPTVR